MKSQPTGWQQLVSAARRAPDVRETAAPYGFSTRVVALAFAAERKPSLASVFDRFSWRALGIAALLAAASAGSTYASGIGQAEDDTFFEDTMEMLVWGLSGS